MHGNLVASPKRFAKDAPDSAEHMKLPSKLSPFLVQDVLGFIQIVRPSRFDFDGAW